MESLFGYTPKSPNGVLIVLGEPGGESKPGETAEDHRKGNGKWYVDCICQQRCSSCEEKCHGKDKRNITKYRNRFSEYIGVNNISNASLIEELKRCFYTCLCYDHKGTQFSDETGYGALEGKEKVERFLNIKEAFLVEMKKYPSIKSKHIFLYEDTYKLIKKNLSDEESWGPDSMGLKKYTKDNCTIYSIIHPMDRSRKSKIEYVKKAKDAI